MPDRAFIIHGYLGYPEEAWLPWLKAKLEKRGYDVCLPAMPNPDRPTIPEWTEFIAGLVGDPDGKTVLIAHSLGCRAVLHYLETLGAVGRSVEKTVLVAGEFPTGMSPEEAERRIEGDENLKPWLTDRVDSPWYPSARLYRQPAADDWASPLEAMAADWKSGAGGAPFG